MPVIGELSHKKEKSVRNEEEIRRVFHDLGAEVGEEEGGPVRGLRDLPANAWRGDNFKYGYLMGKLAALGWVLGDPIADLKNNYDFEDYVKEENSQGHFPSGQ